MGRHPTPKELAAIIKYDQQKLREIQPQIDAINLEMKAAHERGDSAMLAKLAGDTWEIQKQAILNPDEVETFLKRRCL